MPHHNADTSTAVYCPTPLPANAPPQITIHYVHSVVGVVGVVLHTYCAAAGEATCRSLAHSTNTVLSISPLRQVRNSVYKLGVYGWHGASWHRHGVVGALFTCILEYPVVLTRCILFRSSLTHALSVYNNAPSVNIISKPRRPFAGFLQHVEEQPQPDAHTGTNRSHGRPHACIVCGQPHRHFLFFESYEFLACGKRNSYNTIIYKHTHTTQSSHFRRILPWYNR